MASGICELSECIRGRMPLWELREAVIERICGLSINDLTIRAEADIIGVLGRFCKPTGGKPVNSAAVSVVKWI